MHNDTTGTLVRLFFFGSGYIYQQTSSDLSLGYFIWHIHLDPYCGLYITYIYGIFFYGDYAFTILGSLEADITKTNSDLNVSIVQLK